MLKIIRFVLNHLINNTFDGVLAKAIGVDGIAEALPFTLPTIEQIYDAAHSSARNYGDGTHGKALAYHRIGLSVQQIGEEPTIRLQQELEGGIIIKVFLADCEESFKIVVYGDNVGTWQYITPKGRA